MNDLAIYVQNVTKSFHNNNDHKVVLRDLSLRIKNKESLVLIGGSGSGKSVLFKIIMGILKPDQGSVFINDIDISKLSKDDIIKSRLSIGMLFQNGALFDSLNVEQNIVFGLKIHKKLSKNESRKIAIENLELVGLNENVLSLYPHDISGGMKKRVAFARVIAMKPNIILFDEPTSGLDPIMSNVINDLIVKITRYLEVTSFTITHDIMSARKISDTIAMLNEGSIIWTGTSKEMDKTDNLIVQNFIHGVSER